MTAVVKDLYIEQGATFIWAFRWQYNAANGGAPINLTGFLGRMQIRKGQKTTPILLEATTANGKMILGKDPTNQLAAAAPTNGWVWIEFSDDETDLIIYKASVYDVEVEAADGRVYRLWKGAVSTDANITQETEDAILGS